MRAGAAVVAVLGMVGVALASAPAHAQDWDRDGWRRQEWREHEWREHRAEERWRERERWEHERREHAWREQEWRERAALGYPPPPVAYAPPVYGVPGVSVGFGFR